MPWSVCWERNKHSAGSIQSSKYSRLGKFNRQIINRIECKISFVSLPTCWYKVRPCWDGPRDRRARIQCVLRESQYFGLMSRVASGPLPPGQKQLSSSIQSISIRAKHISYLLVCPRPMLSMGLTMHQQVGRETINTILTFIWIHDTWFCSNKPDKVCRC